MTTTTTTVTADQASDYYAAEFSGRGRARRPKYHAYLAEHCCLARCMARKNKFLPIPSKLFLLKREKSFST